VTLTRAADLSASLRYALPGLSEAENRARFGAAASQHGHNYRLEVTVAGEPDPPLIDLGGLQVDLARREVAIAGRAVHLTPIEYRLLTTLAKHAGKVLTRNQLLTEVWGRAYADQVHYLHVHMAQLRQKVEADPTRPRLLLTETGVGYRMAEEA